MDDRLRYFKVVVELRSITDAATVLHITQPALSIALRKLEHEIGAPLLHRSSGHFEVTEAGRIAYDYATDHLLRKQTLLDTIASRTDQQRPLRIGMIDSMADIFCQQGDLLQELEKKYRLALMVDSSAALLKATRRQALDYAFIVKPTDMGLPAKLQVRRVADEALIDIASSWVPDAKRLIVYNQESLTYSIVEKAFQAVSRPFEPDMFSTSPDTMLRLVQAGWGHAVLPFSLIQTLLEHHQVRPRLIGADGFARRPIGVVFQRKHDSLGYVIAALQQRLEHDMRLVEKVVAPLSDGL